MDMALTTEQRAALGRASWANRPPKRARPRQIRVTPAVYEALEALKGRRTWSAFLSDLAGLPPPLDGRRRPR